MFGMCLMVQLFVICGWIVYCLSDIIEYLLLYINNVIVFSSRQITIESHVWNVHVWTSKYDLIFHWWSGIFHNSDACCLLPEHPRDWLSKVLCVYANQYQCTHRYDENSWILVTLSHFDNLTSCAIIEYPEF